MKLRLKISKAYRFIKGMYLMGFKIHNGVGKASQKLRHKRFIFPNL